MRKDRRTSRHGREWGARGWTIMASVGLAVALSAGCGGPRQVATEAKPKTRQTATVESINTVDASQFELQPVARVEELFVGRFPGVQVYTVDGQVKLQIRGVSTLNGDTEPLILVDGQPLTPGSGGLIGLNPRDIQKIQVLKDAVSIAEYGVRGANGVVRITTKRPR